MERARPAAGFAAFARAGSQSPAKSCGTGWHASRLGIRYNERMSGKDAMRPAGPGVKLTHDDFLLFPDDGQRHELIDGEHYVTPTPILRHQLIVGNLYYGIRTYLESHPIGTAIGVPLDVILSRHDVVEPDLLYVSNERGKQILQDWARGAPDLVVEVSSPSTRRRDETLKLRLYERFGVLEYWFVDSRRDAIVIHRRQGDAFTRPIELSREAGDVLTTPLLPALELPLAQIFKE
jgi:Uma2 family endonuclease